jgi:hypothetical protein
MEELKPKYITKCDQCGSSKITGKFIETDEQFMKYIEYCKTCKKEFEVEDII